MFEKISPSRGMKSFFVRNTDERKNNELMIWNRKGNANQTMKEQEQKNEQVENNNLAKEIKKMLLPQINLENYC